MKKKILDFLVTSFYILILMILSIFIFWELYAKNYIDTKINNDIGSIKIGTEEIKNNSILIMDMLNIETDES